MAFCPDDDITQRITRLEDKLQAREASRYWGEKGDSLWDAAVMNALRGENEKLRLEVQEHKTMADMYKGTANATEICLEQTRVALREKQKVEETLRDEIRCLVTENTGQRREIILKNEKIEKLKSDNEKMGTVGTDLQNRYDKLRAEIACKNVELSRLDRDLKTLQHSCEMHQIDKERLQQRYDKLWAENQRLRERITQSLPFDVDPAKWVNTWRYEMRMMDAGRTMTTFHMTDADDRSTLPAFYIPREDWDKMGSPTRITVDWH